MRYLLLFLAAIFVLGDCRRQRADDDDETPTCTKHDVDTYLDDVMSKVRGELPDPMRLPPRSSFVELRDGLVWGLSELKKVGKAIVECDGKTTTIKGKLTTDELKARYTWIQERKNKSPREGNAVIISHDFEADFTLVLDHEKHQVHHPVLERFQIQRFKDVKVEITGMGYFTWALGEMTTLLSGIFQRAIASTVQGPLKEALERKMSEITFEAP